jgi:hypothetical protein
MLFYNAGNEFFIRKTTHSEVDAAGSHYDAPLILFFHRQPQKLFIKPVLQINQS